MEICFIQNTSPNNGMVGYTHIVDMEISLVSAQWLYIEVGQTAAVESDEVGGSFSCFPHHFT